MHGHRLYIICLVVYLANRYQFYMIYDFMILIRLSLDKKMHQQFLTQLEIIESLDITNIEVTTDLGLPPAPLLDLPPCFKLNVVFSIFEN